MAETPTVRLEVCNGVATISLDRPKVLNVIDAATADLFRNAVEEAASRADVRCVLIRGEGRAFCAGGDIAPFRAAADRAAVAGATMNHFHAAVLRLAESRLISVAAVHGATAGAGVALAMACDFAIAAENARFSLAYAAIGGTLDGGSSWFLPRLVGVRKAKELAFLSERFEASEALRLGIVNRVVPLADLEAEAVTLARRLAAGPSMAYGRIKNLIDAAMRRSLAEQLEAERAAFEAAAGTADFAEGIDAFFAKRNPVFQGR